MLSRRQAKGGEEAEEGQGSTALQRPFGAEPSGQRGLSKEKRGLVRQSAIGDSSFHNCCMFHEWIGST